MIIDEAIKILSQCASTYPKGSKSQVLDAFRLGIAALKAWKEFRGAGSLMDKMLLPGETKENERT